MTSSLLTRLVNKDRLKLLMMSFSQLDYEEQCDFFAFQGHSLNQELYAASKEGDKNAYEINLEDLKTATKSEFYGKCDKRLKSFIDKLTDRAVYKAENSNFKSNIYENMLKARNIKFTSKTGLKEHVVVYLASGKSMHSSQVFSKQGGKGTRPILEKILTNSEDVCKFSAPEKAFLFYSYDNIQTILKSYRIGGNHQKRVLAIVVCSILCLMFMSEDGKHCELQYKHVNSPANWYKEYMYVPEKDIFVEQLSSNILKQCAQLEKEEIKVIDDFFENELKDALDYVSKDIDDNLEDSVDMKKKSQKF